MSCHARAIDSSTPLTRAIIRSEEDIASATTELLETREAVIDALVPRDEADSRNVILEVRAGTGGDEAALFTGEVLSMYERYAALKGWKFQIMSLHKSGVMADAVAVREATVAVAGDSVFGRLKFECGVHRVQRIPVTEGGGRVHTSTMSVVVLPEPEEIDVELKPSDLIVSTLVSVVALRISYCVSFHVCFSG